MTLSHYSIGSSDKALVFLHGLCEDKSIWLKAAIKMDGYRCIALDLPGFGESPMDESIDSLEAVADAVVNNLRVLGVSRAVLYGHSYGGYVGLAIAKKYPQFLVGLGLINSTVFADSEEKKLTRKKTIEFIGRYGVKLFVENLFPELFSVANRAKFAVKINELTKKALSINPSYLQRTIEILASRPDFSQWLQSAPIPILYLVGKQDTAVSFQSSMAQIGLPPDVIIQILEQVGHISIIEDEEKTIAMINFFAKNCF